MVLHLHPPRPVGRASGAGCYLRLGWVAIDIAVTSRAIILDSHSRGTRRSRRESPHVMRRAWREMALSPLPLDGAVSRAALWVSDGQLRRNGVAGVTVPGGFSFARTRGLLRVTPPKRRPALEWSPRTGSEDSGAPLTAAGQTPEPQSTRRGVRRSSTPATIGRRPGASASAQSKRASRRSECSGGHGVSRQPFR